MKNSIGNIQFLLGTEGIKKAYEMTLKAEKLDIVCLSQEYDKIIGVYFDKDYAPRLFGGSIKTREILPDTEGNRRDSESKEKTKNQVRFLNNLEPSESDYMLFGNTAILVSYNQDMPFALVIEDREIVSSLKSQFNGLWEGLR